MLDLHLRHYPRLTVFCCISLDSTEYYVSMSSSSFISSDQSEVRLKPSLCATTPKPPAWRGAVYTLLIGRLRFCSASLSAQQLVNLGLHDVGHEGVIPGWDGFSLPSLKSSYDKSNQSEVRLKPSLCATTPNHPAWRGAVYTLLSGRLRFCNLMLHFLE